MGGGMPNRKAVIKAIRQAGFAESREGQGQGHIKYVHVDGRSFTIPDLGRSKAVDGTGNAWYNIRSLLRRNGVAI